MFNLILNKSCLNRKSVDYKCAKMMKKGAQKKSKCQRLGNIEFDKNEFCSKRNKTYLVLDLGMKN